MSPKMFINDYFDISEKHKGDKIQQYDTISMYTVYMEPLQRIINGKSRLSRNFFKSVVCLTDLKLGMMTTWVSSVTTKYFHCHNNMPRGGQLF